MNIYKMFGLEMQLRLLFVLVFITLISDRFLHAHLLQPTKDGLAEIDLIIVPGAQISPDKYIQIAKEIQRKSSKKIWINIHKSDLDIANPSTINADIQKAKNELRAAGSRASKVFIAGHSLGGVMIQHLRLNNDEIGGLIFLGSFIQPSRRALMQTTPSITIAGELDGLTRLSRIAESYYLDLEVKKDQDAAKLHNAFYVIQGMNHSQFSSGRPPLIVGKKDLNPEISSGEANHRVAAAINEFLDFQMSPNEENSYKIISNVDKSSRFFKPFIEAMLLEGSYKIKPPCSESMGENCFLGSPWTSRMFKEFIGLEDARIENIDEFRNVWRLFPSFHPKIYNSYSGFVPEGVLKTKTISQVIYEHSDDFDTGSSPASALEIRVKFSSRQAVLTAMGEKNVDFNESDGEDACKRLNQMALNWAINASSTEALSRYNEKGIPMVIGDDLAASNTGPQWIWTPLSFTLKHDRLEVRSPCIKTAIDFPVKFASGIHYCKLLSPARALEWINIDSLRGV